MTRKSRIPSGSALALGLGLMSCVGSEPAQAQTQIEVLMLNGETWESPLQEVRKVTYQDPQMVFSLSNGQTRKIPHSEIRRITFGPSPTTRAAEPSAGPGTILAATVSEGKARVSFALPEAATLRLEVLSLDGARIRTLVHAPFPAGAHALDWDGRDDAGRGVKPGAFLVLARAGGKAVARKLPWIR